MHPSCSEYFAITGWCASAAAGDMLITLIMFNVLNEVENALLPWIWAGIFLLSSLVRAYSSP